MVMAPAAGAFVIDKVVEAFPVGSLTTDGGARVYVVEMGAESTVKSTPAPLAGWPNIFTFAVIAMLPAVPLGSVFGELVISMLTGMGFAFPDAELVKFPRYETGC